MIDLKFLKKPKQILALDLGSSSFKLVMGERQESGFLVTQMKFLELPPRADDAAARQAALSQLLQGIEMKGAPQVVSVIDDPHLIVKQVFIPKMPESEWAGAIRWELESQQAVPEDLTIDCDPLQELEQEGAKKLRLLAATAPSSSVAAHLELLNPAGLKPHQLAPKPVALAAWLKANHLSQTDPAAVLDLGARNCEFLVAQKGEVLFARKIPVSGDDITQAMTGVLMTAQGQTQLSESEAESLKRILGIPRADLPEAGPKGISGPQLLGMIRGTLERLALELERSLVFYAEATSRPAVNQLILVGGGANLKGLPEWLKERLGIQVTVPDPLQEIPFLPAALEGSATHFKLAFVPALGAMVNAGAGCNLLPLSIRQAGRTQVKRAALKGIVTAALAGALLLKVGLGLYHGTLRTQINAFRIEEQATSHQLDIARCALAAEEARLKEPQWEETFRRLSLAAPREIFLTALTFQEKQMLLRGEVRTLAGLPDQILADFMKRLTDAGFGQVRLNTSRQKEEASGGIEFEIECRVA